jgi:hypothetical protein
MNNLKSFIPVVLFVISLWPSTLFAQDTVQVQTLNFSDISKRKGSWQFPNQGERWEKILMHYTLKCDPQTKQDRFDCGEWDYLSYITVTDSTGNIDSTLLEHANFLVGWQSPDSFLIQGNGVMTIQQYYGLSRIVDTLKSIDSVQIGSTSALSNAPLSASRVQYFYTAQELSLAGMKTGVINSITFRNSTSFNTKNLKIKLINPGMLGTVTGFVNAPGSLVFSGDLQGSAPGDLQLQMAEEFFWDGMSDIILEFSQTPQSGSIVSDIEMNSSASVSEVKSIGKNKYYEVLDNSYIELKDASTVASLDSQITVMFWAKGNPSLPINTSLFEAKDAAGNRVLNAHWPWGNGNMYWDAGNEGGSYDRIFKTASTAEIKGQWNHWALVKNAQTGDMKIYLNGNLWHSGTGFKRSMNNIASFSIGRGVNNYQFRGCIDQFQVWKKEISATNIKDWMNKPLDNSHPNYSDLVFEFDFEDGQMVGPSEVHATNNNAIRGYLLGSFRVNTYASDDYRGPIQLGSERPTLKFYMADQVSHLDSTLFSYEIVSPNVTVSKYDDTNDPTKRTSLISGYSAGYHCSLNPAGAKIDSIWIAADSVFNKILQPYYKYFERINNIEIGRYITPYGIGLDLGPNGFKWIYDVTDYASVLKDWVTLEAGNQQELIDLRFEFIKGTPPRDVVNIQYLSNRESRQYRYIADDTYFKNQVLDLNPASKGFKLITRITGHGHEGLSGNGLIHCCEWADKEHRLLLDGKQTFAWDIWQDDKCALNPVYDQGGNWAPPRAGWCPGAVVDDYVFELTPYVTGNQVAIDYDIEDVPAENTGQGTGNYVVSMHLVEYDKINHTLDAAIKDIISPNSWEFYSKINPTCATPKIVLQNRGSDTLRGALLKYGVLNGNPITFYWQGALGFMEEEVIDLPFAIWDYISSTSSLKFFAEVELANSKTDDYAPNNRMVVDFDRPEVLGRSIEVMYRNNNIADADLRIWNDRGDLIYSKIDAPAGTLSRETVEFDAGCYKMEVETENGFGLAYPLIPEIGTGFMRLRQTDGTLNTSFNLDFGKRLTYYFTVGYALNEEFPEEKKAIDWSIFPNPSNGIFTVLWEENENAVVKVLDMQGRLIYEAPVEAGKTLDIDLSNQSSGIYQLQIEHVHGNATKRLFKN